MQNLVRVRPSSVLGSQMSILILECIAPLLVFWSPFNSYGDQTEYKQQKQAGSSYRIFIQ